MSDTTHLRRDPELEALLLEEARQAMREGRFIPDAEVDRWLEDWRQGKRPAVPPRSGDLSSRR